MSRVAPADIDFLASNCGALHHLLSQLLTFGPRAVPVGCRHVAATRYDHDAGAPCVCELTRSYQAGVRVVVSGDHDAEERQGDHRHRRELSQLRQRVFPFDIGRYDQQRTANPRRREAARDPMHDRQAAETVREQDDWFRTSRNRAIERADPRVEARIIPIILLDTSVITIELFPERLPMPRAGAGVARHRENVNAASHGNARL